MRQNGFSLKARQSVTLDDFRGVDYSSSPMRVSRSRATDLQNLIIEDGIVRKRHGWRELFSFPGKINGIYDFSQNNCYIVHTGTRIYSVNKETKEKTLLTISEYGSFGEIEDRASSFFYYDGTLYILCGMFLGYGDCGNGKYILTEVGYKFDMNYLAYIPTTSISINPDGEGDQKRISYESANLLTPERKNKLVGVEGRDKLYKLDGTVYLNDYVIIEAEAAVQGGSVTYRIDCFTGTVSGVYSGENKMSDFKGEVQKIRSSGSSGNVEQINFDIEWLLYDPNGSIIEMMELSGSIFESGELMLSGALAPLIDGESNITVTFTPNEARTVSLGRCKFGMTFGAEGNTNRLFLSGHPDYPNADFYSEQDNFLYFPSGNVSYFGTGSVPITGYGRLSDNSMAVYKADNPNEPTIYYRTGTDNYVYDASGNLSDIQTVFKVAAGAIGEGNASPRACTNFAGDNLIISKNGIFGIVTAENLATNEKYAKPRSVAINPRLTKCELTEAISFVHKNRLYVSVGDECYVADSAYKYVPTGTLDGAFSYEWWRWTNIPAVCFAEVDGELYFGTADGRICKFDEEYSDRFTYATVEGDISVSGGAINCNKELFKNGFIKVGERIDSISGISRINENGDLIYLSDNDEIYITEADEENCTFKLGRISDNGYESYYLANLASGDDEPRLTLKNRVQYLAYWVTPLMDMGTNVQGKTLERLTISVEPECNGKLTFGYETRVNKRDLSARGLNDFSFDAFDFCDFHFETEFASSFTARVRERNFNYIRLRYASSDKSALGVNNITLTFKRGSENKGLR